MRIAWIVVFLAFSMFVFAPSVHGEAQVDTAVMDAAEDVSGLEEKIPVVLKYDETKDVEKESEILGVYLSLEKKRVFEETNTIAVKIPKAYVEPLKREPGIKEIKYDPPVHAFLSDSVPLINATLAFGTSANGTAINGAGQTICVIDTGINYSHPDLGGCAGTSDINDGSCSKVIGGYNYCANDACSSENSNPLDNHGHGTHVAGIVAANGSVTGVAPGARLVIMKALNSTGSGSFSDIEAAVRWCTNNATKYNITVISMSLGTTALYSSYCDSSFSSLADAINNATANNISVVVATGNSGSSTGIASPACIENSTAVTSSTKTDGISSFSNRNALTDLIAPGSSIVSTSYTGGNTTKSGTSMSAPHVAGAFALLKQYEQLEGQGIIPSLIESTLNATGKLIYDSSSDRNYSRLNIFAALQTLDNTEPAVNIDNPANTTRSTVPALNFTVSDNIAVDTCWYINTTGQNVSLSSCANTTINASDGYQNITVYVNDTNGNTNSSQVFFTLDTTFPAISVTSPENTTYGTNNITLNFTATDTRLDACFYSLNDGSNTSLANCNNITFIASSGANTLVVYANDTANNTNSSTIGFTVNIAAPILAIQNPDNITYAAAPQLNFTVVDSNTDSCWYSLDNGETNTTLASCANISSVGNEGFNTLTVYANDTDKNTNSSSVSFTIDTTLPEISLTSPTNATQNMTSMTLNFTVTDANTDSCWYINTTGNNVSLGSCSNTTFTAGEGYQNISVYANDTAGNTNFTQQFFTTDTTFPVVSLVSPANRTYNTTNITLNYTFTESRVDRCWFKNVTGDTIFLNTASGGACSNATFNASEGYRNVTIYVNDTAGNENSSQQFFTVDLTLPELTFTAPTPNNEIISTTNTIRVNVTGSETLSAAILNINGTLYNMTFSENWTVLVANMSDGNYSFNVTANDTTGNENISETRWVYINATRNVTSFLENLSATISISNATFTLRNATSEITNNITDVVQNYTLSLNLSNITADLVNFTWLTANQSAVLNITDNVTRDNVTIDFVSSGGVLDKVIWIDVNNFTSNFTPRVTFPRVYRIFYYINGSRENPERTRIITECDADISTRPCFSLLTNSSEVYLANFSGAAAGNDTKAPNLSVSSPISTTYESTNITLSYTAADNVALDQCWYRLGGSNSTLTGCGNITFTASEGNHVLRVAANDTSGNTNTSEINFTVSIPVGSSGGGGGSSGGGGGASTKKTEPRTSQKFAISALPGTSSYDVNVADLSVSRMFLTFSTQTSGTITISKEESAANPYEGQVYQYFSVESTMEMNSAEIHFSVPRSWIQSNDLDETSITLRRFSNVWEKIPTTLLRITEDDYVYSSTLESFSLFAITGDSIEQREIAKEEPEIKQPEVPQEEQKEKKPTEPTIPVDEDLLYQIALIVIAVLLVLILFPLMHSDKKHKIKIWRN